MDYRKTAEAIYEKVPLIDGMSVGAGIKSFLRKIFPQL